MDVVDVKSPHLVPPRSVAPYNEKSLSCGSRMFDVRVKSGWCLLEILRVGAIDRLIDGIGFE